MLLPDHRVALIRTCRGTCNILEHRIQCKECYRYPRTAPLQGFCKKVAKEHFAQRHYITVHILFRYKRTFVFIFLLLRSIPPKTPELFQKSLIHLLGVTGVKSRNSIKKRLGSIRLECSLFTFAVVGFSIAIVISLRFSKISHICALGLLYSQLVTLYTHHIWSPPRGRVYKRFRETERKVQRFQPSEQEQDLPNPARHLLLGADRHITHEEPENIQAYQRCIDLIL